MNRIRELVDQAKKSVPAGLAPMEWLEVYHDTLAKIIIEECANVADRYVVDGDIDISEIIKRHFGVKE